jgi:hypothetical protein
MRVETGDHEVRLALSREELHLLRRALERALLIDTPPAEQPAIAAFCSRALEALGAS